MAIQLTRDELDKIADLEGVTDAMRWELTQRQFDKWAGAVHRISWAMVDFMPVEEYMAKQAVAA